jgi:hypothetical protein
LYDVIAVRRSAMLKIRRLFAYLKTAAHLEDGRTVCEQKLISSSFLFGTAVPKSKKIWKIRTNEETAR